MTTHAYPPVLVDCGRVIAVVRRRAWLRHLGWALAHDRRRFVLRRNLARFEYALLREAVTPGEPNSVWLPWTPVTGAFAFRGAQRSVTACWEPRGRVPDDWDRRLLGSRMRIADLLTVSPDTAETP